MKQYIQRKSVRVKWDTYQNGCYFVTICTKNRTHDFGEIRYQKMYLSLLGAKLAEALEQTPNIRDDQYIDIPIFAIMPNHLHFIITLNYQQDIHQHHFGTQRKNLSSVVRGIKSSLTYFARCNDIPFNWQSRFHEHIIRNQQEFEQIYQYIEHNVLNWENDCFFN